MATYTDHAKRLAERSIPLRPAGDAPTYDPERQKLTRSVRRVAAETLPGAEALRHRSKGFDYIRVGTDIYLPGDQVPIEEFLLIDRIWCAGCGEEIETDQWGWYSPGIEVGEFIDTSEGGSGIYHAQCGLDRGLDLA